MNYIFFAEYYEFWLNSIDSFCNKQSPIIVVGTHADKISETVSFKVNRLTFSNISLRKFKYIIKIVKRMLLNYFCSVFCYMYLAILA